MAVALFVVTLVVFLRATANGFINYDDPVYVTDNVHVRAGLTADGIRWALTSGEAANWHPLTWLSHMLDVSLFGLNPAGHHFTNVLLHALNAAVAFLAFRRLTGALATSAVLAMVFALHPLRVESVAWVAERKDVLSGSFFFLCLWVYARYAEAVSPALAGGRAAPSQQGKPPTVGAHGRRGAGWYVVLLLAFALGLMAKPMLVTLPCVLLLLDYWPLQRIALGRRSDAAVVSFSRAVVEKLPLLALAVASCVVTYDVQKAGGAVTQALSLSTRLANAVVSVPRYLGAMLWPSNLIVLYPHPERWAAAAVSGALAVVVAITVLAIWQHARRPWLLVGWLWFFGMLVPVVGIVQVGQQSIADRYTYLPSFGVALMLIWTAREWWGGKAAVRRIAGLVLVLGAALAAVTLHQLGYWRDSLTLFDHAIAVAPGRNYMAYNNRGYFHFEQGNYAAAAADYRRALAINPDGPEANNNVGEVLTREGRDREAIPFYEKALRANPRLPQAHNNLANALADLGQSEAAFKEYELALQRQPHDPNTLNNYGAALAAAGRLDDGEKKIEQSLQVRPDYASAHANLGNVLAIRGRREEALAHYARALALEPNDARTYFNQASVLAELGRHADAATSLERAVKLSPVNPDAHAMLGLELARLGRRDDAVRELRIALQQRPDHPQAKAWLQALQPNQ